MVGTATLSSSRKWQLLGCLVLLIVALDQSTKLYIHTTFALYESRPVIANLFAITYVRNSGAAFGMLARQSPAFLQLFFPAVTALALIGLLVYFSRLPAQRTPTLWGVCLIISGALGNGIDRLWLGQVIDFLDVHWYAYHWPAFNVADSSICIGVGLLLLDSWRAPRTQE
ncbi:MAG: signal peptidase II [Candidatus Tectimicrobiota bacterium]